VSIYCGGVSDKQHIDMDNKLRKFLRSSVFDKRDPHVYIVVMDGDTIKNIWQACDSEINAEKKLFYYEIKKLNSSNNYMYYFYRSINKIPEHLDYKCI
jgi:hypothetical protein